MHRPTLSRVALILFLAGLLLPAAGCGTKAKKKPATIAQKLEQARAQKTPEAQARELIKVARSQFRSGDKVGAAKTLAEAKGLIPADGEAVIAGARLVEIAEVYAQMDDRKPAREVMKQALEAVGRIEDPISRIRQLADAGAIYGAKAGGLGDSKAAREAFDKASEAAASVEERFKAQALAAIAAGYAKAGLAKDAAKMVDELEASARAIEEPRPKAEALAAAANVLAQNGDKEKAAGLLDEAAAAAKSITQHENKTYALLAVTAASIAAGDAKSATALVKLAEKEAGLIGDPEAQKNAIEKVRAMQGDLARRAK